MQRFPLSFIIDVVVVVVVVVELREHKNKVVIWQKTSTTRTVQFPHLLDGDPHPVRLFKDVPQGPDGTFEQRREGNVCLDALGGDELSTLDGLTMSLFTQRTIVPSREDVLQVPRRFTMPDQDQRVLVSSLDSGEAIIIYKHAKKKWHKAKISRDKRVEKTDGNQIVAPVHSFTQCGGSIHPSIHPPANQSISSNPSY